MKALVVLAGGKATRLGPLAHGNKALLSVGARPMIAYHYEFARRYYDVMIVVAPPGGVLRDVVGQMESGTPILVVNQDNPTGDLDAMRIGFTTAVAYGADMVSVIFADSLYDDLDEIKPLGSAALAFVATTRVKRAWTFYDGSWQRGENVKHPVFTGLMHLGLYTLPHLLRARKLEEFMRLSEIDVCTVKSWHDVGDPPALISRAFRELGPPKRTHHRLSLGVDREDRTVVRKTGVSDEELRLMQLPSAGVVPPVTSLGRTHGSLWYETPFLEMENLGELWTYWPLDATIRDWLVSRTVHALDSLWKVGSNEHLTQAEWLEQMLIVKPVERLRDWAAPDVTSVHGRDIRKSLLRDLLQFIKDEVIPHYENQSVVTIHGDPNFTNVLVSLRSGEVRIVDRRQEFGSPLYDIAKIWYSPKFARTVHGLIHARNASGDWSYLGATRSLRLPDWSDTTLLHVRAAAATILLSAPPLHEEHEALPLYLHGLLTAEELLREVGR